MKTTVFLLIITIFMEFACSQNNSQVINGVQVLKHDFSKDDTNALSFYCQYSYFTDPGDYAYLYKNLPNSLPELCRLIKSQFIHPFTELPQYRDLIPNERWNEWLSTYPTVQSILKGFQSYDSRGLVKDRKVEDRLILGCREYSILLASILKYRGIPARVRAGHAAYLEPGFHLSHTICEVWNEKEKRWMLVDPSTGKIDFNRAEFDFSNELWLKMRKNEINPDVYIAPPNFTGLVSIVGKINPDLASILGIEYPLTQYAPILELAFKNYKELTKEQTKILDSISKLMETLDATNLSKLLEIYNNTPLIQMSKAFAPNLGAAENSENNTNSKNISVIKPEIEFVDIPGGTFIMGSPDSEQGRIDNEIKHKVTLSPFKMSKYIITVEQYNLFCESTGRKKPWYGPYGADKMPVTQVTWFDATAFAEWMGCRLPTEAEFEYATRANTTTAFYTGECLSTDQANYNGKEPYLTCEKGINRKRPILVGSFAPNAFGLFDMHGNMCEWCSDWFGDYNINEELNPKGPEKGETRVIRGGGFWHPGWKCRSAFRNWEYPGNRGTGLSFRIVKN